MKIKVTLSTTYHPQIGGQTEQTIHTLEDMLRACSLDFDGNWSEDLPLLVEWNLNEEMKYEEVPIRIMDTKEQVLRRHIILYC